MKLIHFGALLALTLGCWSSAIAQITPSSDGYVNSADPTTNYGAATTLDVDGASQTAYIQFDLASIPAGAVVGQATLKLYVNGVSSGSSLNVEYVDGAWSESAITYSTAPPLGSAIASNVHVTLADKNQYVLINVTPAVVAWLNGSVVNNGIALVANGAFHATFDSKENTGTSHPPELDIVFAGSGTITGVTPGAGLSGGGSSGDVTLKNTGILHLAAGTGISIGSGQSPTVSISAAVPLLAANNTFTGNQTVNGNLSATGVVTGSGYQIGSNLFAFGSYTNSNAFLGFGGNTTMTGGDNTAIGAGALASETIGTDNTASGVGALASNTLGAFNTASGSQALFSNTSGNFNSAVGAGALQNNTTGGFDTASGYGALGSNTIGSENTASGYQTLGKNTSGIQNTGDGVGALGNNTTGSDNTAGGAGALALNTSGTGNTASGQLALGHNTTGNYNVAAGSSALGFNTTGGDNIGIGLDAGSSAPVGNNNSIYIGSTGASIDANGTIRIGSIGNNTGGTYIAGIYGATAANGVEVYVNSNGLLGTVLSSRRFKDHIADMGDASSKLFQLRPVTFFYKPEYDDGSHQLQYGLIAEEVAKVYPDMVAYDKDGRILTVKYQLLAPMLLNEVQKQAAQIRSLEERLSALEELVGKVSADASAGQ